MNKPNSEAEELRSEWKGIASVLPSLSLTPRGLIYIAIGWALVALFFVWLPIVFAYAGVLILWHLGRLFSGAVLKAGDVLRGPKPEGVPSNEEPPQT